jgi:inward rectifier potassium channel
MYPDTFYGHLVTTVEIVVGMFGMAAITGLIFVRFSRPTAGFYSANVPSFRLLTEYQR